MNIPAGSKAIIKVPGWAIVVVALVADNMIANICKASIVKHGAQSKDDE